MKTVSIGVSKVSSLGFIKHRRGQSVLDSPKATVCLKAVLPPPLRVSCYKPVFFLSSLTVQAVGNYSVLLTSSFWGSMSEGSCLREVSGFRN